MLEGWSVKYCRLRNRRSIETPLQRGFSQLNGDVSGMTGGTPVPPWFSLSVRGCKS